MLEVSELRLLLEDVQEAKTGHRQVPSEFIQAVFQDLAQPESGGAAVITKEAFKQHFRLEIALS